jgi:hypothetical protein
MLSASYGDKYPQSAIVGALRTLVTDPSDGTTDNAKWKQIVHNPDSTEAKNFEKTVQNWQATQERTRGGTGSTRALNSMSATDMFKLASELQTSADNRTNQIFARTVPTANSYADRLAAVQGSFPQDNTRQGGGPVGPLLGPQAAPPQEPAPKVTPKDDPEGSDDETVDLGGTGSAGLDSVLASKENRPAAEFQIGGELDDPISSIFDTVTGAAKTVAEAPGKLFESLSLPGRGLLTPDGFESPRAARQAQVDQLQGAGREDTLRAAKALKKQGKISLEEGEGNSADDSLLIAYFKYLEAQ